MNKQLLIKTDLNESLSGSDDSESDEDESSQGSLQKKMARMAISKYQDSFTGKSPLAWISSSLLPENTLLGVHRALFPSKDQLSNEKCVESVKAMQLQPVPVPPGLDTGAAVSPQVLSTIKPYAFLCMIGGGHFAAMVVSLRPRKSTHSGPVPMSKEAIVIAHKGFHRYTTRRKQGGSQSANDNAKGAAHSAGAEIRRYNEQALIDEVRALLKDWKHMIDSADLLFVRATGNTNRRTLFGPYEGQVLHQNDPRLRTFPFNTRRATQSELMRAFIELTRVKVQDFSEQKADLERQAKEQQAVLEKAQAKESYKPQADKVSEEEETALLHTSQIQALIRRSKLPALLSYFKSNDITADFRFHPPTSPQHFHTPTPLHFAASLNNPVVVTGLLVKGKANPELLNGDGKPPFDLAGDRPTRDAFRLARSQLSALTPPTSWDWDGAHIPSPLTDAEISSRNAEEKAQAQREEAERRKAELDRLAVEGPKAGDGTLGRKAQQVRQLALQKTAQQKREEEARGLTPEMRMKLERERRARAAEERLRRMQGQS
jgi:hypothetical protein